MHNPLCSCPKYGAWSGKNRAQKRLEEIQQLHEGVDDPHVVVPVRVYMCSKGVYHLTSMPLASTEREE